jgi:membrane protein
VVRFCKALYSAALDFWRRGFATLAASIAFFSLLSFFPLVFLLLHLLGYFVGRDQARLEFMLRLVRGLFPDAAGAGSGILADILRLSGGEVVQWFVLLAFAWSAMQVFGEVDYAVNVVFGSAGKRNPIASTIVSMGLLMLIQALLIGFYVGAQVMGVVASHAPHVAGLDVYATALNRFVLRRVLPSALVLGGITFIYRYVPRNRPSWRKALSGAIVFAPLWELARHLFERYLVTSAHYGRMYGSLLAVVLALLWIYCTAALLLYGAAVVHRLGPARKTGSCS